MNVKLEKMNNQQVVKFISINFVNIESEIAGRCHINKHVSLLHNTIF